MFTPALAAAIDRKLVLAGKVLAACGVLTLFGIIHSPLDGNRMFVPFGPESWGSVVLDADLRAIVLEYSAGYFVAAIALVAWKHLGNITSDDSESATAENAVAETGSEPS